MDEFIGDCLSKKKIHCFFDPIKKKKLATFTSMNEVKKCKVNSKTVPLPATQDLFAKILLVAQIRSLNMRVVSKFPLGPLPWSLAESLGSLKKTSKASLLHKLEGKVESLESLNGQHVLIVGGTVYVQQSKVVKHLGTLPTISFKESCWLEQDLPEQMLFSTINVNWWSKMLKEADDRKGAIFCLNRSSLHLR